VFFCTPTAEKGKKEQLNNLELCGKERGELPHRRERDKALTLVQEERAIKSQALGKGRKGVTFSIRSGGDHFSLSGFGQKGPSSFSLR